MAKLSTLTLPELYERKITAAVEKIILLKEDFSSKSDLWCDKVCKLKTKNPPGKNILSPTEQVDVLIIQDYADFNDPKAKFQVRDDILDKRYKDIIEEIFREATPRGVIVNKAITSLLKCKVTELDITKGKAPGVTILNKCRPYLFTEIEQRKPKVIISLSTSATKVLADKVSNNGNRGEILRTKTGVPIVLTLHPRILTMLRQNSSGAFWGPDFYSVIVNDFRKAIKVALGELNVPDLPKALENAAKRITIARNLEDIEKMCSKLVDVGIDGSTISYDIETNCLDPYGVDAYGNPAKIILIQFGFRNENKELESYVFPMWHKGNTWYDPDEAWIILGPLLADPTVAKVGHNIKFDIRFTAVTTGIRPRGILCDTMLLLHALNSGIQGQYSLKQAVWDWLPDTELGNYEDQLPKLSKIVLTDEEESDETTEDELKEEEDSNDIFGKFIK